MDGQNLLHPKQRLNFIWKVIIFLLNQEGIGGGGVSKNLGNGKLSFKRKNWRFILAKR